MDSVKVLCAQPILTFLAVWYIETCLRNVVYIYCLYFKNSGIFLIISKYEMPHSMRHHHIECGITT